MRMTTDGIHPDYLLTFFVSNVPKIVTWNIYAILQQLLVARLQTKNTSTDNMGLYGGLNDILPGTFLRLWIINYQVFQSLVRISEF